MLFIEKEGFDALLKRAQITERFDIAIMSTKGMSVVAARRLIDYLSEQAVRVFVLHDFDVSGFSILGTLGSDGRRYTFDSNVKLVDLGLRLADVDEMGLAAEPVEHTADSWRAKQTTLFRHGATDAEVRFLRSSRVELNAMTSSQFIDMVENKLREHDVCKVVPTAEVMEQHARKVMEAQMAQEAVKRLRPRIAKQAAAAALPDGLLGQVLELLDAKPHLAWDDAVSMVVRG